MMALPLTWRPGAANPFGRGPKMRSIPVCHVDDDLRRTAQRGLERAQAGSAQPALGGGATPKIDDSTARTRRPPDLALCGRALCGGKILIQNLPRHDAIERTPHLERGLA